MKNDIIKDTENLIEKIKTYCQSQKHLWQQIPNLALEADGREFYLPKFQLAYTNGFWDVTHFQTNEPDPIFVDLATGDLLDADAALDYYVIFYREHPKKSEFKSPPNKALIKLAFKLEKLDAAKTILELKEQAQKPYNKCYNPKEQEEGRKKTRRELNLTEIYIRKNS